MTFWAMGFLHAADHFRIAQRHHARPVVAAEKSFDGCTSRTAAEVDHATGIRDQLLKRFIKKLADRSVFRVQAY